MIAGLKEKFAAFDQKRLYTAVGALAIAGLAGYFMQRSMEAPAPQPVLAAAVPAKAGVIGAQIPALAETKKPAMQTAATEPSAQGGVTTAPGELVAPDRLADVPENLDLPFLDEFRMADSIEQMRAENFFEAASLVTRAAPTKILAVGQQPAANLAPAGMGEDLTLASVESDDQFPSEPKAPVAQDCAINIVATPKPAAMIELSLYAPCNPGEEIVVSHAGLKFSDLIGPQGDLVVDVPAMTEDAVLTVRLKSGEEKSVEATIPDFDDFERIAVAWKGATGLQIDALENDASYGDPGHVWAENPASPKAALDGTGGFVTVLGSVANGFAADVYTYPVALGRKGGQTDISVEAAVTENTCNREITGEILRSNPGRAPTVESLSMMAPKCDAVGGYLVLKNLPQDLKLARN